MAIIKIELDTAYDQGIITNFIKAFGSMTAQPEEAVRITGTDSPVALAATPFQGDVSVGGADEVVEKVTESAPTPEKKPRKPREVKQEPVGESVGVTAATEEPSTVKQESTGTAPDVAYSLDDVRTALQNFTQQKSIEEGLALLKEFKAGRISELAEEDYAAFIEKAKV